MTTRARVVLAAVIAALPLVGLVAFAAVERYNADFARSRTRATTRAELYATLLDEGGTARPTPADLAHLLSLNAPVAGDALAAFDDRGQLMSRTGAPNALTDETRAHARATLAGARGTVDERGADGVRRVWGFSKVDAQPIVVGFGTRGVAVYGAAQHALKRDLIVALGVLLFAVLVAFVLGSRVTAPIRRMAGWVEHDDDGDELTRIERRLRNLDVAVEARE